MRIKIFAIIVAVLLLAGCTTKPREEDTIVLGFVGPLTGDAAPYGQTEKNVVMMAIDEINNSGGINGKQFGAVFEDGKCEGKTANTAASKLINIDKVKIILGGACSGETLSIAPLAEKNKVIVFSAFSSSPDVTNAGDFVFRNAPSDLEGGKFTAKLIPEQLKKIGIISENTPYAQGVRRVFKEEAEKLGKEILADELFEQSTMDVRTQLTKIKAAGIDSFLVNAQTGKTAGLIVKQARELGIDAPIFGTYNFAEKDFIEAAGTSAEGAVFSNAPNLNTKNPKSKEFLEKYEKTFGSKPSSDFEAGARYDSIRIIAMALEEVGYDTEKIRDWLYKMPEYEFLLGKLRVDRNWHAIGIS